MVGKSYNGKIDSKWLRNKNEGNSKNEEGKKKVLKRKSETKGRKKESIFSLSDDDCADLCNLENLKQKKRKRNDSSIANEEEKQMKKTKRKKAEGKQESLLNFDNDNLSEDSGSYASDELFQLNIEKHTKSLKGEDNFKLEDFLQSDFEERSISVLSDSSLDSIVNVLQKSCKVKRGKSDKKNPQDSAESKKKKGRRKRDKLLDLKLTDTDTSEAEEKWKKHKMKKRIQSSDSKITSRLLSS